MRNIAYGVTAALAAAVVVVELLHAPTLVIFAFSVEYAKVKRLFIRHALDESPRR